MQRSPRRPATSNPCGLGRLKEGRKGPRASTHGTKSFLSCFLAGAVMESWKGRLLKHKEPKGTKARKITGIDRFQFGLLCSLALCNDLLSSPSKHMGPVFCRAFPQVQKPPATSCARPRFVVGDSHVLSLAWQFLEFDPGLKEKKSSDGRLMRV